MTNKGPQILKLSPNQEIVFEGPFTQVVTSYLELQNPSNDRVLFKVKTTAPKRYCVRPNSGLIQPGDKLRISIMLQPNDLETPSERNKHKFMVQSVVVYDDRTGGFDQIWQEVGKKEYSPVVMDSKLRCVFRLPASNSAQLNLATDSANLPERAISGSHIAPTSISFSTTTTTTTVTSDLATPSAPSNPANASTGFVGAPTKTVSESNSGSWSTATQTAPTTTASNNTITTTSPTFQMLVISSIQLILFLIGVKFLLDAER